MMRYFGFSEVVVNGKRYGIRSPCILKIKPEKNVENVDPDSLSRRL